MLIGSLARWFVGGGSLLQVFRMRWLTGLWDLVAFGLLVCNMLWLTGFWICDDLLELGCGGFLEVEYGCT